MSHRPARQRPSPFSRSWRWGTFREREDSEVIVLRLLAVSGIAILLFVGLSESHPETCAGLAKPVEGRLVQGFAPTGRFSGHWGVDWEVPPGSRVRASGPGTVTFAGSVVGNQVVTVAHGGGLRTSYSYLATLLVRRGDRVTGSTILGTSGMAHGSPSVHFSVRVGDTYLDPFSVLECRWSSPSEALRLVPVRLLR